MPSQKPKRKYVAKFKYNPDSWYQSVCHANYVREGKDPIKAMKKDRWKRSHVFPEPHMNAILRNKISEYLNRKGVVGMFNGRLIYRKQNKKKETPQPG